MSVTEWGGDAKTRAGRVDTELTVSRHLALLTRCGIPRPSSVLDFGCGDGALVDAYARAGFDSAGCEIRPVEHPRVREISSDGALPFDDGSFDLVISETVLEHVPGTQERQMSEWARVLRSGGAALHLFPPRTGLVESHTMVPVASIVRHPLWLGLWARIGVRAPHQRELAADLVAKQNAYYLAARTNYLSRRHYQRIGIAYFERVRFVEREWMLVSARRPILRKAARFGERVPLIPGAYGALYYRVMLLEKHGERSATSFST